MDEAAVAFAVIGSVVSLAFLALSLAGVLSEPHAFLVVEVEGVNVSASVEPRAGAELLVNGTPVPRAAYSGDVGGFLEWARHVAIRFPDGGERALYNYAATSDILRPHGEYMLYEDGVLTWETDSTKHKIILGTGAFLAAVFLVVGMASGRET